MYPLAACLYEGLSQIAKLSLEVNVMNYIYLITV